MSNTDGDAEFLKEQSFMKDSVLYFIKDQNKTYKSIFVADDEWEKTKFYSAVVAADNYFKSISTVNNVIQFEHAISKKMT